MGALVVPADSSIQGLADLKGRRIGIAGGALDKSWLLVRALAQRRYGLDLTKDAEPVFAAPPLLNKQLEAGALDAVINFWHYVARLEAKGFRRVVGVDTVASALGLTGRVPLLGYVLDGAWQQAHPEAFAGFVAAYRRAKEILRTSDAEWERIRPLMRVNDDATHRALRDGYRSGIPQRWGAQEIAAAEALFEVMSDLGGPKLVGEGGSLAEGTFAAMVGF